MITQQSQRKRTVTIERGVYDCDYESASNSLSVLQSDMTGVHGKVHCALTANIIRRILARCSRQESSQQWIEIDGKKNRTISSQQK